MAVWDTITRYMNLSGTKLSRPAVFTPSVRLHQPPERQIVVGICAMTKKSKSKPMTQILERLCKFDYINVVIFPEEVILEEPVEKWPLCDCLISFHSKGKVTNETLVAAAMTGRRSNM